MESRSGQSVVAMTVKSCGWKWLGLLPGGGGVSMVKYTWGYAQKLMGGGGVVKCALGVPNYYN